MPKAKKKAASPAQLIQQRKLTTNERNWSFVLLAVSTVVIVAGVWYYMTSPNWSTNGNFGTPKVHTTK